MITVTDDELGVFTGETMKDIDKQRRKARAAAKAKRAQEEVDRKMAYLYAHQIGYRVLRRVAEGGELYRAWGFSGQRDKSGVEVDDTRRGMDNKPWPHIKWDGEH